MLVKTGNSRIFVFMFSKKCAQTKKSLCLWFSTNKKFSQTGRIFHVWSFLVSSKLWR